MFDVGYFPPIAKARRQCLLRAMFDVGYLPPNTPPD
jgi:hypothetical protein